MGILSNRWCEAATQITFSTTVTPVLLLLKVPMITQIQITEGVLCRLRMSRTLFVTRKCNTGDSIILSQLVPVENPKPNRRVNVSGDHRLLTAAAGCRMIDNTNRKLFPEPRMSEQVRN